MAHHSGTAFRAMACLSLVIVPVGCATPDRRLTSDQASCQGMGHVPETPPFRECLKDLNDRRCATATRRGGTPQHVASADCTRIN